MTKTTHPEPPIHEEKEITSGSSAFGFFHKYQKQIIYTAGIFTLLTFSITGAITGAFERWFGRDLPRPTMNVPGLGKFTITQDDMDAAQGIARVRASSLRFFFPPFGVGESEHQYVEQLAGLRALALHSGIDASGQDVDKIVNAAVQTFPTVDNIKQLALSARYADVTRFREHMREALRVGTFVRLSALGVEQSDEEIVQEILDENERVTFQAMFIDSAGYKDGLKKGLTKEVLLKYLEGLEDGKAERFRKPANRTAIKVALLDPTKFDDKPYRGKELDKDLAIGDQEIRARYVRDRDAFYKLPEPKKDEKAPAPKKDEKAPDPKKDEKAPDPKKDEKAPDPKKDEKAPDPKKDAQPQAGDKKDGTKPEAGKQDKPDPDKGYQKLDDALQKRIRNELLAERVLSKWLVALDGAMADHMMEVINRKTAADIEVSKAKDKHKEAEAELADAKDKPELKKKVEEAKKALDAAEAAAKVAAEARDKRRSEFDFAAAVQKLSTGRPGLTILAIDEMKDAEGLRNLPGLGEWRDSHLPGQMTLAGEIYGGRIQTAKSGPFLFQVAKIEPRPFRDYDEIKSDLETEYLNDLAGKDAKQRKEAFEKALERLAREKQKDDIAKLEKAGKEKHEKEFATWKEKVEGEVKATEKLLAELGDPTLRSYQSKAKALAQLKEDLGKADEQRKKLQEATDKDTKSKVDEKLVEAHKDVAEAAAKEAKLSIETIGPYSRKLSSRPRFQYRFPKIVQAVFSDAEIGSIEAGDEIALKEDPAKGVTFMAVCTKVEKGTRDDISRRQWLAVRSGRGAGDSFAGKQMVKALETSWTIEALKEGYGFKPPAGSKDDRPVAKGANDKSPDAKDKGKQPNKEDQKSPKPAKNG
ncbi:MAG: hypothetical protein H6837_18610 [Planctomycetes bacterium]|nr:hypothetical protein [Planctomycetota bacterium]